MPISGIEVVEPVPQLAVARSTPDGDHTIYVDGLTIETAFEIPWDDIVGTIGGILKKLAEGSRCVIVKTTLPDGSTVETKVCPPGTPQ